MNPYLVGFALYVLGADPDWTQERRASFLLDPRVEFPKSVDSNVWEQAHHAKVMAGGMELPLPYWDDEEVMLAASGYREASSSLAASVIVLYADHLLPGYMEAMGPRALSDSDVADKVFLGYDVADEGLTSGLSNCGYEREDREAANVFAPLLNRHGLFDTIEAADDFRRFSDQRVPEHSPFYVYGLYVDKALA
jgi:hypothetical protein